MSKFVDFAASLTGISDNAHFSWYKKLSSTSTKPFDKALNRKLHRVLLSLLDRLVVGQWDRILDGELGREHSGE